MFHGYCLESRRAARLSGKISRQVFTMKLRRMRNVLVVLIPLVVIGFGQAADTPTTADELVQAALQAEADGSADPRNRFIAVRNGLAQ